MQRRLVLVQRGRPPEVGVQCLRPVVEAFLLGYRIGVRVVLDVPFLQVVLRLVQQPVAALPGDQLQFQARRGIFALQVHRAVVDLGEPVHRLVFVPGAHLLVPDQVLEHEDDVVDGERSAVRPLGAGPQGDGERALVRRGREALGQIADDAAVGCHLGQTAAAFDRLGEVVPGVGIDGEHAQGAAVPADLFDGLQHRRVLRQALVDRRQFTGGHQRRQHGRFVVPARRHAGGTALIFRLGCRPGKTEPRDAEQQRPARDTE